MEWSNPLIAEECLREQISALTDAKLEQREEALYQEMRNLRRALGDAQEEHLMILREQQQRRA
jgi:DNA-binding winged helix-turn-helix (wHTH) protein